MGMIFLAGNRWPWTKDRAPWSIPTKIVPFHSIEASFSGLSHKCGERGDFFHANRNCLLAPLWGMVTITMKTRGLRISPQRPPLKKCAAWILPLALSRVSWPLETIKILGYWQYNWMQWGLNGYIPCYITLNSDNSCDNGGSMGLR